MGFPHTFVVRVSWLVSAVVAVLLLAREFRDDDAADSPNQVSVVSEVRGVPRARAARPVPKLDDRMGTDEVIVSLTMVGDGETLDQGFTLTRSLDVRVLALGEGTGGEMHDYGVILDAATRRPIWRMRMRDTHHAGGAEKNRMIDEVLSLDAGSYLVHYVSDDSHSYGDWNSAAPEFPELWGITLLSAHGSLDRDVVRPYDPVDDESVLARIVGVRDDEYRAARFTLDRPAEIRVYAIGEGDRSDMYDYALIEDAGTGAVVWRMSYSRTEHAGGAQKNRLFDGVIRLQAGQYSVVYQTDGSHSSGDWNSSAPDDPFNYGVTVSRR